jgi:flagellar motility protein MotE (MotC chaperone)
MIRFARDFRLIPIVLLATVCLFALKVSGLVFDGGYTLAERLQNRVKPKMQTTAAEDIPEFPKIIIADKNVMPAAAPSRSPPKQPWAQEMFGYNNNTNKGDVTGSTKKEEAPAAGGQGAPPPAGSPALTTSEKAPEPAKLEVAGTAYPLEPGRINSPGERAVLERLQDRRQELESRTRDLEMRENLLKAAEKRVEAKVTELKEVEARINSAIGMRDKTEAERFKSIVTMYEGMKSKDAARIFDRLDLRILVDVANQIKPAKMSEIMAAMTSESAERLTVELANRASATPKTQSAEQLPKIEGKTN